MPLVAPSTFNMVLILNRATTQTITLRGHTENGLTVVLSDITKSSAQAAAELANAAATFTY